MRINIVNREFKKRGPRRHDSEMIMSKAMKMPYAKKMIIEEKKTPMRVYDRLKHFNMVHDCGMEITKKGNFITIMKKSKHRVSVLGAKENNADKENETRKTGETKGAAASINMSEMPKVY